MKYSKNLLLVIVASAFLWILDSCSQEWLDVNNNPNYPQEVEVDLIFPITTINVAYHYGGAYNVLGGFWAQHWAQSNGSSGYKDIDSYNMNKDRYGMVDYNKTWRLMYANEMMSLQYIIERSKETDNMRYLLMSTVMQAFCFEFMTDLYDAIPYSEALQGDPPESNFNPVYDEGESIYLDLIDRIDRVLEKVDRSQSIYTDNADIIFYGDLDQWIRFANTLKLRMFMRMSYAKPLFAREGIEAMYVSNTKFLSSDAKVNFLYGSNELTNPMYYILVQSCCVGSNLRVSETLFRYYKQNLDPRLNVVCEDEPWGMSASYGMPQGGFNIPYNVFDSAAVFNLNDDDSVYLLSEVESYLLQAEAIIRGWGTGNDKYYYDLAITTDFSRKGLAGEEVTLIGANGPYEYPASGTMEEKLEAIIMAKWAALAGSQDLEAFFESSRTGYPEVSTIPSWVNNDFNPLYVGGKLTYSLEGVTGGIFPRRMIYPSAEVENNENFPGQTSVTDKIWWDKKIK